jgi:hypothetical protein
MPCYCYHTPLELFITFSRTLDLKENSGLRQWLFNLLPLLSLLKLPGVTPPFFSGPAAQHAAATCRTCVILGAGEYCEIRCATYQSPSFKVGPRETQDLRR